MDDDRIRCSPDCRRYLSTGICAAAAGRIMPGSEHDYRPVATIPRRCFFFLPVREGSATGSQRWPFLDPSFIAKEAARARKREAIDAQIRAEADAIKRKERRQRKAAKA